jgi:hypothetical protein
MVDHTASGMTNKGATATEFHFLRASFGFLKVDDSELNNVKSRRTKKVRLETADCFSILSEITVLTHDA